MNPPPRDPAVEYEFGVPIPGRILPPEQWAKTALKKLPPAGPLDWASLFGRQAGVVLDLGCGNGRFTLASALARPELDHLALDALPVVIRYATRRANQRGLGNVRFAVSGAHEFLEQYVAAGTVREIHLYHPQPYPDPRQALRRLVTPDFLALVHRSLEPEGLFVVQTDNRGYWKYLSRAVPRLFDFHEQPGPWPDMPEGRSRREIYAIRKRLPVFRGWGRPLELAPEELARLVAELPRPEFDARR